MSGPSESSTNIMDFKSSFNFAKLLLRLKIAVLEIEDWIILQRSKFDITVAGQPYHALQLYINSSTGVHLTRVWGKTCLEGKITPNSVEEIGNLCDQVFGQGMSCCPGNIGNNSATKSVTESLMSIEYPFQRKVSLGCAVLYKPDGHVKDATHPCPECSGRVNSRIDDIEELLTPKCHISEVKNESLIDSTEENILSGDVTVLSKYVEAIIDQAKSLGDVKKEEPFKQVSENHHDLKEDPQIKPSSNEDSVIKQKPKKEMNGGYVKKEFEDETLITKPLADQQIMYPLQYGQANISSEGSDSREEPDGLKDAINDASNFPTQDNKSMASIITKFNKQHEEQPVKAQKKKIGKYKCHKCNKIIGTASGLQSHIDRHNGTLKHKCPDCEKTFTGRRDVNRHLVAIHKRELDFNESTYHNYKRPKYLNVFKSDIDVKKHSLKAHNVTVSENDDDSVSDLLLDEELPNVNKVVLLNQLSELCKGLKDDPITEKIQSSDPIKSKVSSHPPYLTMVTSAVERLQNHHDSSRQALLKFIMTNYSLGKDKKHVNTYLKSALRKGIKRGIFRFIRDRKVKGDKGAFKLAPQPPVIEPDISVSVEEGGEDKTYVGASNEESEPHDEQENQDEIKSSSTEVNGADEDYERDSMKGTHNDGASDFDELPDHETFEWYQQQNIGTLSQGTNVSSEDGPNDMVSEKESSSSSTENPANGEELCDPEISKDLEKESTQQPSSITLEEKEMHAEQDYEGTAGSHSSNSVIRQSRRRKAKIHINYASQLKRRTDSEYIRLTPDKFDISNIARKNPIKLSGKYRNPNRLVGRKLRKPREWTEQREGERHQCEHCDVSLSLRNDCPEWFRGLHIAKHYRRKHLWGNFYCSLCNFFAYYPHEYASHMLGIHPDMEGGVFAICTECNENISLESKADTLVDHYKECVESWDNMVKETKKRERKDKENCQESTPFMCQLCGKVYKRIESFRHHLREHRLAKHCTQTGCKLKFKTLQEKRIHEDNDHKVPCEKCDKIFKNKPQLKQHDKQVHIEMTPCEQCGKMLKSKKRLQEHIELEHEKKLRKGVKCTECDMVLSSRPQMYFHRNRIHHPKSFQCETCKKSFGSGHALRRHGLVHSGKRNFTCDECGKQLKERKDLVEHKRAHSGEKLYACQYCPYRGTSSSLLWHHKRQRHKAEHEEETKAKKAKSRTFDRINGVPYAD